MVISGKSLDKLKQQKKSFINFIKTKEKYSGAIVDLFYDDEVERIDTMQGVKDYLKQKGIPRELLDDLETDYISYLRTGNFYGSMDNVPDDLKQSVIENDKVLRKLKRDILKEYRENEEILLLKNIEEFVDSELGLKCLEQREKVNYHGKEEGCRLQSEITRIKQDLQSDKCEVDELIVKIGELKRKLVGTNIFQRSIRKKLNYDIANIEERINGLQEKINLGEEDLKEKSKKLREVEELEHKVNKRGYADNSMDNILSKYSRSDAQSCKESIGKIKEEISDCLEYLSNDMLNIIKEGIYKSIRNSVNFKKESLYKLIDKYFSYFYYGEYKKDIMFHDGNGVFKGLELTVYSKNSIDNDIYETIYKLGGKIEGFDSGVVDSNFINDIFIHTTGFNVLDKILEEGGLLSTNEMMERKRHDIEISKSMTQEHAHHKDIYFSRGFRQNGNGYHEGDDDFVFIVNTMNNFAKSGYGVPLNNNMQPNSGLDDADAKADTTGYSIISKSALEKDSWGGNKYSYSKIDVKHFYIFVSETKRKEIESNPKYQTQNANIIYFPKEYQGKMSYKLYEFMKNEIALRDGEKENPIPSKIITNKDGIESISGQYKRAFCDSVGSAPGILLNPLKKGDGESVVAFLKGNQSELGFPLLKRSYDFEIDFPRLEKFLSEQKSNIDNFESPFDYPKELLLLTIICTKLGLRSDKKDYNNICLNSIKIKLQEFGYTAKDLGILCKSVQWISYVAEYKNYGFIKDNSRRSKYCSDIKKWCDDWWVDFDAMKDFLIKISTIALRPYVCDLIKEIIK